MQRNLAALIFNSGLVFFPFMRFKLQEKVQNQIQRICMFIEKNHEMNGTTPAACLSGRQGVEFPAHNDVSINM
jgi:hypothetical protein